MKKVISFSLWGDDPTYNIGAIRNAETAKEIYPDFQCWFYIHHESVPQKTINQLRKLDNTRIIYKFGNLHTNKPMMWRFEAIDEPNVEVIISRDTDTRFLTREKLAVDEWLDSDKLFHIMRDHPHHDFLILGGMFGTKKLPNIPLWKSIMEKYSQKDERMYDQDFLREHIYPIIKDNSMVHASFHKYENHAIPFPIPYCNEYKFVGEYVYFDESRSQNHINELKSQIKTEWVEIKNYHQGF